MFVAGPYLLHITIKWQMDMANKCQYFKALKCGIAYLYLHTNLVSVVHQKV